MRIQLHSLGHKHDLESPNKKDKTSRALLVITQNTKYLLFAGWRFDSTCIRYKTAYYHVPFYTIAVIKTPTRTTLMGRLKALHHITYNQAQP
jgi:hypothetical protein